MRRLYWLVPALALYASCLAAGTDWTRYDSGRFSVLMPGTPKQVSTGSQWVSSDPEGRAYNASSGYLMQPPLSSRIYFDKTVATAQAGVQGRLLYQKFLKVQDRPACDFKITDGVHVVGGRLVLDGHWIFILEFASSVHNFDASPMDKFFGSFRIDETVK